MNKRKKSLGEIYKEEKSQCCMPRDSISQKKIFRPESDNPFLSCGSLCDSHECNVLPPLKWEYAQ